MEKLTHTDAQLVMLLVQDDEAAFKELYVRYKDKLFSFCFSFLKAEDETQDMVQEIFIRIWEIRHFLEPRSSFSSFLYTVARNRVLNYLRDVDTRTQAHYALQMRKNDPSDTVESEMIYREYQKILSDAIEQLPLQRKRIFNMSRMENLSHKEIASQLDISVYTVQEHISEALRFIRIYFSKHSDLTLSLLLFTVI